MTEVWEYPDGLGGLVVKDPVLSLPWHRFDNLAQELVCAMGAAKGKKQMGNREVKVAALTPESRAKGFTPGFFRKPSSWHC